MVCVVAMNDSLPVRASADRERVDRLYEPRLIRDGVTKFGDVQLVWHRDACASESWSMNERSAFVYAVYLADRVVVVQAVKCEAGVVHLWRFAEGDAVAEDVQVLGLCIVLQRGLVWGIITVAAVGFVHCCLRMPRIEKVLGFDEMVLFRAIK